MIDDEDAIEILAVARAGGSRPTLPAGMTAVKVEWPSGERTTEYLSEAALALFRDRIAPPPAPSHSLAPAFKVVGTSREAAAEIERHGITGDEWENVEPDAGKSKP